MSDWLLTVSVAGRLPYGRWMVIAGEVHVSQ